MKAFLTLIITSLICLQASALSEVERNLWKLSGGQLKPVVESWPLTVPSLTVDHSTSTASLIYGFGQTLGGATYYPTLTPQSSYAGPVENVRTDVGKVYYLGSATKLPGFDFIDYANPATIRARMYMDTDGTVYYEDDTGKGINLSARPLTTTGVISGDHGVTISNPTATADQTCLFVAPGSITITSVKLYCVGGTITGHLTIEGSGVDGATDITGVQDTVVADDGTLSAPTATVNQRIGWRTTSTSGSPTFASITWHQRGT